MADTPAPAGKTSSFGFLGRKIGPVPIWLIGVAAVGAYYWYRHYGPGAKAAVPAAAAGTPATNITIRETEAPGRPGPRGPRGRPGPRGPFYRPPGGRRIANRKSYAPAARGPAPRQAQPVAVAAPMTSSDVYGSLPTAMPDGSTYDSGDVASTMGAAYAVAG